MLPKGDPAYRVALPRPPSANNLFLNVPGKGRVRSKRYKAWAEEAGKTILAAGARPRFESPVAMLIEGVGGIDVDNIKAVPDLLKTMGVLADDKLIDDLRIVRAGPGDLMTISVWNIGEV